MSGKDGAGKIILPPSSVDIDKMGLWGTFMQSERNSQWREKVAELVTRKSLDLAIEQPDVQANPDNRQYNGLDWRGVTALAALAFASLLVVVLALRPQPVPQPIVQQPPAVDKDTDTDTTTKLQWGD